MSLTLHNNLDLQCISNVVQICGICDINTVVNIKFFLFTTKCHIYNITYTFAPHLMFLHSMCMHVLHIFDLMKGYALQLVVMCYIEPCEGTCSDVVCINH